MDDEMTPIDESEMMDLFGDGADTTIPEVIAEDTETPLEQDLLEQTPAEQQEVEVLEETGDQQIEEMEEEEGMGTILLHPDNMQELANFIGEEQIDRIATIIEGDLEYSDSGDANYVSPLATIPDEKSDEIAFLRSIMGEDAAVLIQKVAKIQGKSLDDIVRIRGLPRNLNRVDILDDSVGTPHYLQIFDDQGNDITDSVGLELDVIGQLEVDAVFSGSAMTGLKEGSNIYNASTMGRAVSPAFQNFYDIMSDRDRRQVRIETLQWIRQLVTRLNEVFGFDDYRQLEAFIAAWLMRNSTTRLSGIPGTGKTTVINCAATLLGNSYGYHINKTYLASDSTMAYYPQDYTGKHRYSDISQIFASNDSLSNTHVADVVPSGQSYNVMYNDQRNQTTYSNWDDWRFRDWSADIAGSVSRSGAYTYAFNFLRTVEQAQTVNGVEGALPAIDDDTLTKKLINPETFHKILFNCWEVEVPDDFDLKLWGSKTVERAHWNPSTIEGKNAFNEKKKAGKTRMVVKPIQIHDGSELVTYNTVGTPSYGPFEMSLRYPDYNSTTIAMAFDHVEGIDKYVAATGQGGLYTDTGRNEGYWLRHMMCHWMRDVRTDDKKSKNGRFDISVEMLNEIGVAKIDYDKRPDEVLYGLEIRAVEAVNQSGETVNTYEFEPVPREIVTQSIKFFNEANRSQSGVEDAVLGLIAEKLVEYRGKTFKSPDFVAWMDTNPHQKGNDLAFTDRIDMELLFKSVSLGGRYDQLVNTYGKQGGLQPNQILVEYLKLDEADPNSFKPMRIGNLFGVWKMVGKETKFTSPGSSYDGFRDISVISVLFSQIFAKRPETVNVGGSDQGVQYSFADISDAKSLDLYESPLLDYSTTTNTNTSDRGTTSPVLNDDTMIFGSADVAGQLPTVFTRVLGFRFTNSIVKLAQAFAFLRGKESVSRQEILDAVPYAIAHRMGRAKAGAKDMEGNNKGLDGNRIGYVNEQEFVREMVVKGYLEGKVDGVDMDEQNLMDNADYYYNHCRSIMDSVPAVWEYEELVLRPLYQAINDRDIDAMTPIHWHIATMVIEEERKGRGRKVARNYASSMAGPKGSPAIQKAPTNYHEMYSNYESLILNPSPNGEPCLWDYYRLRGFISREANLFTNDRDRLLKMLEGEVRIIAGADGLELDLENEFFSNSLSVRPFPQGITPVGGDGTTLTQTTYRGIGDGPWPRPEQTYWHTYDDAQGTFGALIGMGQVQTYDPRQSASPLSIDSSLTRAAANQSLRVTGRYQQTANLNQSISRYDISKTLNQFAKNFRTSVGAGLNLGPAFPQKSDSAIAMSFDDWIKKAQAFLISKIGDPTRDPENDLWGCFELNHAPVVTPQMGLRGVKGNDKLRLWLRLSMIGQSQSASDTDLIDMLFTVGITSAPALTAKANVGLEAEGPDFEILEVTNTKQYASKQWVNGSSQQGFKSNTALVDSGNMMALDRLYYNKLFANSLE